MKNKQIILLAVLFFALLPLHNQAWAADPVIFFSDLTSAMNTGWEESSTKGAAVSVYGLNFGAHGSMAGSVNITTDQETTRIDNSDSTYMVEWGATTNNPKLDANTTMERITFHLNSSMSVDAAATITITVDGVTSNALSFGVRAKAGNHIYFIDDDGDNTTGLTVANAWQDLEDADPEENASVVPGDIIYIKAGTYSSIDSDGHALNLDDGDEDGSEAAPFAFVGYPGELPKFTVPIFRMEEPRYATSDGCSEHYTFAKLEFEGAYTGVFSNLCGDGLRIVNIFFDMTQAGRRVISTIKPFAGANGTRGHEFLGNIFSGGGYDNWGHHIYPTSATIANANGSGNYEDFTIAYNEIDDFEGDATDNPDNYGGAAFNLRLNYPHITPGQANWIQNGYIHHNYMHDSAAGQLFYAEETSYNRDDGDDGIRDIYVYNNLMTNNNSIGGASAVVMLFAGFGNTDIDNEFYAYNNTFYESCSAGACVKAGTGANWTTKNNIYYETTGEYLTCNNSGNSVSSAYDLFYGNGDASSESGRIITHAINNTDPNFTDSSAGDFSLSSPSDAIGGGTADVSGTVVRDLFGLLWSNDFDVGAIKFGTPDPDPDPDPDPGSNSGSGSGSSGCFIDILNMQ